MKKLMMFSLIAASFLMSCNQKSETKNPDSTKVAATYQCPMDCEKGKTYEGLAIEIDLLQEESAEKK